MAFLRDVKKRPVRRQPAKAASRGSSSRGWGLFRRRKGKAASGHSARPPERGGPRGEARRRSPGAAAKQAAQRKPTRPQPRVSRREQERRRRARRRVVVAAVLLLVLGTAAAGVYRGLDWLRAQPLFTVKVFDVVMVGTGRPGLEGTHFEERYLVPYLGQGIFSLDLTAVRTAVEADPWVEKAVLTRVLPDRLRLQLVVRNAVAVVAVGRRGWLVDEEGETIEQIEETANGLLPRIRLRPSERHWVERPEAIKRALTLLEVSRRRGFPAAAEIRHLGFDERGDPVLVADHGGIEIFLGRGDYTTKLDRLALILPDIAASNKRVARIDLRFKEQAVVAGPG